MLVGICVLSIFVVSWQYRRRAMSTALIMALFWWFIMGIVSLIFGLISVNVTIMVATEIILTVGIILNEIRGAKRK